MLAQVFFRDPGRTGGNLLEIYELNGLGRMDFMDGVFANGLWEDGTVDLAGLLCLRCAHASTVVKLSFFLPL